MYQIKLAHLAHLLQCMRVGITALELDRFGLATSDLRVPILLFLMEKLILAGSLVHLKHHQLRVVLKLLQVITCNATTRTPRQSVHIDVLLLRLVPQLLLLLLIDKNLLLVVLLYLSLIEALHQTKLILVDS